MTHHDPRELVEDLRDHLAAHDRTLFFLFGAGTSCAINVAPDPDPNERPKYKPLIPGTDDLTEICKAAAVDHDEVFEDAWAFLKEQANSVGRPGNVEDILSSVRGKIQAIGEDEKLVGLSESQLRNLEELICKTIAERASPSEETIPDTIPHDGLAQWIRRIGRTAPLEIFTTNYDVLFEYAFEKARIPVFDGFVGAHKPFFFPECLSNEALLPKPKWVRLWKIHGSVNWENVKLDGRARVIRTEPNETGRMIFPSNRKYDESRKQPYLAYLDRLGQLLNSEHALLITCGYGFNDEHINAMVFGALENRKSANVIALQYDDLAPDDELARLASARSNLTVIAPDVGVISGRWGEWKLTEPVTERTAAFMDVAFDSAARPEKQGSAAGESKDLKGTMRLGDFFWFARFLREMGPRAR